MMLQKSAYNIHELHKNLHEVKIPHSCVEFNREEKRLMLREIFAIDNDYFIIYHVSFRKESRN